MEIVADPRPVSELSDMEVAAVLLQAIRARGLTRSAQVRRAAEDLLPGLGSERLAQACGILAQRAAS